MLTVNGAEFYRAIPPFDDFNRVLDAGIYQALPDDWWVGTADVVASTKAVATGRYKAVNIAGASVICAVTNVLGHADYPFMFGGDGASFACPPDRIDAVRAALAATARWSQADLHLELRVALIPIADIRKAGKDVRVARYAVSDAITYAMFSGDGMQWAETTMKDGHYQIAPAPPGTQPDLSGLSCRWSPIAAHGDGHIISVIVQPAARRADFDATVGAVLALLDDNPRQSHPVSANGPKFRFPPAGLSLEARANRPTGGSLFAARIRVFLTGLLALILDKTGWKMGDFDPARYRSYTALNTDFRKFGDGLWMTVSCTDDQADALETLLSQAEQAGKIHYGTHRQKTALMTCIVPSVMHDAHFHFLDGGEGGYTAAASVYKAKRRAQRAIDAPDASN
ncbi:DUF3095 domain-containing protein [Thalassospira sp.]|uniref:DUF3095 domain-containing protein n=1 Tax=Thalassospira sp. TaxID=1912094 RepID=UPI00273335B1|nr:DUF3095 domain-containing protein [Thalassospira sp.]MDP2698733.1 DUF3095 domain-containing protein [Thalassospira sp.]